MKNNEDEKIYNELIKCIDNVLNKQGDNFFIDEGDFQLSLYTEIKKYLKEIYPSIQIILEYNDLNYNIENLVKNNKTIRKSYKIDIAVLINNNHYLIEIKYSAYNGILYHKGTNKFTILNSEKKAGSYASDIEKLRDLIDKNDCIKCGYCILLTTSNIDKDCSGYCKNKLMVEHDNKAGMYTYYIKKISKD